MEMDIYYQAYTLQSLTYRRCLGLVNFF